MRRWFCHFIILSLLLSAVVWWSIPDYGGDLAEYGAVVRISARDGQPLRVALGDAEIYCDPVPLAEMGEWTAKALIAFEDKRFLRHGGIDSIAVCRAALKNAAKLRVTSGASTLTTLVVKMTEPRRRNLWTKLVEAHHAVELESDYSKEEILEQFLNRAPFGGNVHGIEAASQRYFGKPARNLSLAESALLMGLPQSPATLRPDRYAARAIRRRDWVLWRMLENEFITAGQYRAALGQATRIQRQPLPFHAPHFCDFLLQRHPGQAAFRTTLDLETQRVAEEALRARVAELAPRGIRSGAVVVLDARSGGLLAMVGSPGFWESQVNGATARRSPGSTLKPFAYAAALDQGALTPAAILADVPTSFAGYAPRNYSLGYSGPVSLRRSLVESLNIPALRCVQRLGADDFVRQLRALGFSTLDRSARHYGLGVVVGSGEATLLDLVNAYACLARGGVHRPARYLMDDAPAESSRVYSAEAAFMIADMLGGEERSAELIGHRADVFLPRVAWKTGTSSGHRDAWAVAYNPEYVVGVWMGNPDGAAAPDLVGGFAAAPVAGEIFRRLYPTGRSPWFEPPAGLKTRAVCARSGQLPNRHCSATLTDYFIPRVSSPTRCALHDEHGETWPPEIQAFLEARGMSDTVAAETPLRVISPAPDETFKLLPPAPGIRQEIQLAADARGDVYWFVNGQRHEAETWPLQLGQHTIACADARGQTAQVRIHVE